MSIGTSHPPFDAVKHLLSPKPLRRPKRRPIVDDRGEEVPPLSDEVVKNLRAKSSQADWNRQDDIPDITTSA